MPTVKRPSSTDMHAEKRRSCAAGGDRRWSTLLPELLVSILQRLPPSARDRIRFGCVCSWWRSVLTEARHGLLPPTAPLLMLPYTEDDLHPRRQVQGIPVDWVHRILVPDSKYMPSSEEEEEEAEHRCHHRRKKVICGSSMGWLFVSDRGGDVRLWNPMTREEIPLPPPPRNFFGPYNKVVVSSNPRSSQQQDCTVMTIRGHRELSFCRIGDGGWTAFEETAGRDVVRYDDVICYRGQFYAVTWEREVVVLDVAGPNPKMAVVADSGLYDPIDTVDDYTGVYSFLNYLVESSGELLRVTRLTKWIIDNEKKLRTLSTIKFEVHKLDLDTKTWSKVVSLGDQALFLGKSSSVSFAASASDGYKRNSIYFLDDSYDPCFLGQICLESDMGVFDLEDGSITTFGVDKYTCSSNKKCSSLIYSPQFWIQI